MKTELNLYQGVYVLYYCGQFPMYSLITQANRESCCMPIYVGKATPGGRRTGLSNVGQSLYSRLVEHRRSIQRVNNLEVEEFRFKVVAMEIDLVSWGEGTLIRHFIPIWNRIVTGFGIHAPGKGRYQQQRSIWDQIHPGRSFSTNLPLNNPIDFDVLSINVARHCQNMGKQLGCL